MTPEARAALSLFFSPGLGSVRIKALLERFGSALAVLEAPPAALRGTPGLEAATAAVGSAESLGRADVELERVRPVGLAVVTLAEPAYPEALRAIYDPPPVLW